MRMSNAALILVLLTVASRAVFAAQHVVGGSAGWGKATDYAAWAASKPFIVGDTLVFNHGMEDLVYEVSEDDYKNCTTGKPIKDHRGGGGQTIIPLDKPGPRYFLSPKFGHCTNGTKLAIDVKPITTSGSTGGTTAVTDQLTPAVIPTSVPLPRSLPVKNCPGGGGGLPSPVNPFPDPYHPSPVNPFPDPYHPSPFNPFPDPYHPHGGATGLGKVSVFTIGFYSVLVLVISFIIT